MAGGEGEEVDGVEVGGLGEGEVEPGLFGRRGVWKGRYGGGGSDGMGWEGFGMVWWEVR